MQKDFHYYMTYMAARAAGIAKSRSRRMAEWAEVIDEAFNGTKGQEGGSSSTGLALCMSPGGCGGSTQTRAPGTPKTLHRCSG